MVRHGRKCTLNEVSVRQIQLTDASLLMFRFGASYVIKQSRISPFAPVHQCSQTQATTVTLINMIRCFITLQHVRLKQKMKQCLYNNTFIIHMFYFQVASSLIQANYGCNTQQSGWKKHDWRAQTLSQRYAKQPLKGCDLQRVVLDNTEVCLQSCMKPQTYRLICTSCSQ